MRTTHLLLIAVVFTFLLNSTQNCSSVKIAKSPRLSFTSISFGKSGGFSNQVEKYIIRNNGTVSNLSNESENVLNEIGETELLNLESDLNRINYYDLQLNEVGNMTYFIVIEKDDITKRVSWTDATDSTEIKEFYKTLISYLKK
ncbi:MAG: hypothetical protein V2B15_14435 [Bacteroidota bacterium]